MKIVILGPAWPYRGGIAAFGERLAREYQRQGHEEPGYLGSTPVAEKTGYLGSTPVAEVEMVTFTLQYPSFLFPGKTQYSTDPAPEGLPVKRLRQDAAYILQGSDEKKQKMTNISIADLRGFLSAKDTAQVLSLIQNISKKEAYAQVLAHDKL